MIRMHLSTKSRGTEKIKILSQETNDSQNILYEVCAVQAEAHPKYRLRVGSAG